MRSLRCDPSRDVTCLAVRQLLRARVPGRARARDAIRVVHLHGSRRGSGAGACACRPLRQTSPTPSATSARQAAAVRRPRVRPVLYRRAGDHGDPSDHRSTDQRSTDHRRTDHDHPHLPAGRVVRDGAQPHPGGRRAGRHGRPRRRGRRAGARGRRRRGRAVGHLHARGRPRGRRPHRRGRRPADARPRSDAPGRGAAPRTRHRDPAARRGGAGDRLGRRPGARGAAVARRPARAVDGDARRVRHAARPGRRPAAGRGGRRCCASAPGSASLQGYQAGPERVDDVVRAVFDAARARTIRYAEPPASWGDVGQRVRTPTQVLDERVGTCLDTTLALAAVLEQGGIRPLVWMVQGHAFLGYWREETSLANIVLTDASPVVNLIDLGAIRLVETTMLTSADPAHDVDAAHRSAYSRWLVGDLDEVLGAIDVWTARRNDVLPLPARARTPSGDVQVVTYQAATHSTAPRSTDDDQPRDRTTTTPVPPRVARWKNALLDLSLRNRLINFADRSAVSLLVPPGRFGNLPPVQARPRPLHLYPSDLVDEVHVARGVTNAKDLPPDLLAQTLDERETVWTDVTSAAYPTRLRALAHRARTVQEETGANNLYLALGSLVWDWDGRPLRSPVVLVPVHLVTRARQRTYRIEVDETGTPAPNYCLLEKLRQAGVDVPDLVGRRRGPRPRGGAADAADRGGRGRAAVAGGGHRARRDPPVRQVPALEGPRRALGVVLRERLGAAPRPDADRAVRRRGGRRRHPGRPRRAGGRVPGARRRVAARGGARRRPRPVVRAGGTAGDGQVADDHQPAEPRRGRGPPRALRRREACRARRRAEAARRGRDGSVLARPARQGISARDRARAGAPGARAQPSGRRAGSARPAGGAARLAPHARAVRPPAPLPQRRRAVALLGARRALAWARDRPDRAAVPAGCGRGPDDRCETSCATLPDVADPARPRAAHPWGFAGAQRRRRPGASRRGVRAARGS